MPDVIGPSTTGTNSPIARVRPVRQQSVEKGLWIKKHPPSFLERRKLGTRQSRFLSLPEMGTPGALSVLLCRSEVF
jgi:hypothetical protein